MKKQRPDHPFKELTLKSKIQYLFDYYKLPFVILCILIYVVSYILYGHFTKKNNVLYLAFANVTIGDTLSDQILDDYLSYRELDDGKNEIYPYKDLYLNTDPSDDNYQYAYACSTKVLAAIDSQKLDLVFMDKKAYQLFSEKNYLTDLTSLLPDDLSTYIIDENAIDLSASSYFQEAGFQDSVYLGILDNSPRKKEGVQYICYLFHFLP